jgi:hypothetical protein
VPEGRVSRPDGQVENQTGNLRDLLFRAKPRVKSLAELNAWREEPCIACARRANQPEFNGRTIREVFQDERARLVELRGPFDGFAGIAVRATPICLIMAEHNRYGVNARAAGRDEIFALLASLIRAGRTRRQARSVSCRMSGAKFPVLTARFASLAGANETLARIVASASSPARRLLKTGLANSPSSHSGTFLVFRCHTPTWRNAGLACRQPNAGPARCWMHGAP